MVDCLERQVYKLLRTTAACLKGDLRHWVENYGITWPQFHALYHIGAEGIPFNELARILHCNASNMTGIADRLTENGWVQRERSAADRRVWLIKLTAAGARLRDRVLPQYEERVKERIGVLDAEELKVLSGLLARLKDAACEGDNQ